MRDMKGMKDMRDLEGLQYKTINRNEWKKVSDKKIYKKYVKNDVFEGMIALLVMGDVEPWIINSVTGPIKIADKGFKWLELAPVGKHWWLTVMFDENDEIVECYFDITKMNVFDDMENPGFYDMKLDVTIHHDENPIIIDEEELFEALSKKFISKEDYITAHDTADDIVDFYINNKKFFFSELYKCYDEIRNKL